jgi:hypothetical protein
MEEINNYVRKKASLLQEAMVLCHKKCGSLQAEETDSAYIKEFMTKVRVSCKESCDKQEKKADARMDK